MIKPPLVSKQFMRPSPESDRITISCPPIVDAATWDLVQVRLAENQSLLSARPEHRYLLAGFIVCPSCEGKCKAQGGAVDRRGVYRCRKHTPSVCKNGEEVCNPRSYQIDICNQLVAKAVRLIVTRPEIIARVIALWRERTAADRAIIGRRPQDEETELTRQISVLEERRREVLVMEGIQREFRADTLRELSAKWQSATDRLKDVRAIVVAAKNEGKFDDANPEILAHRISAAIEDREATLMDENVPVGVRRQILRGLIIKAVPVNAEPLPGRKRVENPEAVHVYFRELLQGVPLM